MTVGVEFNRGEPGSTVAHPEQDFGHNQSARGFARVGKGDAAKRNEAAARQFHLVINRG